ncbi:L-gulonolactone oxidase [Pseudonocardia sediminis]|uniref:L-gulonolactone oxidase n=1 Tax=Pseudonocardia sediminis TaxID=1397368 RepID=A0A4Q7V8K8_PSEST|nr:L-gulonolactone oxidase [Pseudonocardia sediminis]
MVTAVRRAGERGATVRPTGASARVPGALVRTSDLLLDCSALTGVVAVSADRVLVRAGERLAALFAELAASGRSLAVVPDAPGLTVGGAVGMGVYGGAPGEGSLSAQVVAARLVDGRGVVRRVSGPELDAVRCGLGALGVLTAVELRTVELERMQVHEQAGRLDAVLAEDVLRAHGWTELDVAVPSGQVIARWADPVDPDRVPVPAAPGTVTTRAAVRAEAWGRAVSRLASNPPWASWPPPARWTPGTEGRPYEVLPDPQPWDPDTAEWAIPAEALGSALRELGAAATARGMELQRPVRVRLGAAETGLLHPAQGRDTAWLRIRTRASQEPLRRLAGAVLEDASGRPSWTSRHEWGPDELAVAYPGWAEFQRVRDEYDPDRRFTDPNLERILGP